MKKNSTVKLLGLLGALVVIYLIATFTSNSGRSKSFRDVLVEIDTAKVTKVQITSAGNTISLQKLGADQWQVKSGELEKKAVTTVVKNFFQTLRGAKPSRLVARSSDNWKDYSVDSTGTRVEIFEGANKSLDLVVGRFGVEGQQKFHTYVRLFEEKDVYLSEDFMGISLPKESEGFRNADVLRLRRDSLTQVSFNYPDSAFSIYNSNGRWSSTDFELDSASVAKYLSGLSYVTSREFEEGPLLGSPVLNVTFGFTNQPEIQISAYIKNDGYIIQSSENEDELFEETNVLDKVFKGPTAFQSGL